MYRLLPRLLTVVSIAVFSHLAYADGSDPILGYWRTIDDTTGFAKAIVQVQNTDKGTYSATIIATLPRPDYTPVEYCNKCPAPFTDRKIIGLPLLWNLQGSQQMNGNNEKLYTGGYIIDPLSGKVYQSEARVSRDGRRLTLRGSIIGMALIGQGRTQTWLREANYTAPTTSSSGTSQLLSGNRSAR